MSAATIEQVLKFVRHQIGVPYQWGGTQRSTGFDCSGLVWRAYTKAGYRGLGRTTYEQVNQGRAVGIHELQPGDIVFPEPGHEGLYAGNGMVIEAPHTGDHVKLIPLSQFGFWKARRLVSGGGGIVPPRGIGGLSAAGLPIPSQNPADRVPHPAAARSAALATLLGLHAPTSEPTSFHLPQASTALQSIDTPDLPNSQPTPLGGMPQLSGQRSPGQLQASLDATRRQLLSV
jgi:hypothetical protein